MKAKLLKELRAKFFVEYFPSTKMYKVNGTHEIYSSNKSYAITKMECDMLKYARIYYEKHSKRIRIDN